MTSSQISGPGEWRGTSVESAVRDLAAAFPYLALQVSGTAEVPYRFRIGGDDRLQMGSIRVGSDWQVQTTGASGYVVLWCADEGVVVTVDGEEPVRPFPVPVVVPSSVPFVVASPGVSVNALWVAEDFFESVAANHLAMRIGPFAFSRNPEPQWLTRLQTAIGQAAPELLNPATTAAVRADLEVRLVVATATAFRARPDRHETEDGVAGAFARAQQFIADHLAQPLTVGRIAASVGVTERDLQVAFHRHGDTTPLAYVRQTRLYRVRSELRDADPETTSVIEVAGRWGFAHFARFQDAYEEEFGRRPSVGATALSGA